MATDHFTHITRHDERTGDLVTEYQPYPRNFEEKSGMSGRAALIMFGVIGVILICGGIIYARMN